MENARSMIVTVTDVENETQRERRKNNLKKFESKIKSKETTSEKRVTRTKKVGRAGLEQNTGTYYSQLHVITILTQNK